MSSLSARLASPWWSRVLVALRSLRSLPSLLLAVVLSLSLVACGPGVGGSGTGDAAVADPLPALGATPQGLCAGELAPLLDCSATAIGAASPTPGTGVVYFIDTIDGRRVLVRLEGNTIELDVPCARLRFSGTWASIGGQAARF